MAIVLKSKCEYIQKYLISEIEMDFLIKKNNFMFEVWIFELVIS